jgi:hypothetical protein
VILTKPVAGRRTRLVAVALRCAPALYCVLTPSTAQLPPLGLAPFGLTNVAVYIISEHSPAYKTFQLQTSPATNFTTFVQPRHPHCSHIFISSRSQIPVNSVKSAKASPSRWFKTRKIHYCPRLLILRLLLALVKRRCHASPQ